MSGVPMIEINNPHDPDYGKSSTDKLLEICEYRTVQEIDTTQDGEQLKETVEVTSTTLHPTRATATRVQKQMQRLLSSETGTFSKLGSLELETSGVGIVNRSEANETSAVSCEAPMTKEHLGFLTETQGKVSYSTVKDSMCPILRPAFPSSATSEKSTLDNISGGWSPVTSGVPQGSVLGLVMFLIYVNEMPGIITSTATSFADDTKIYQQIHNIDDSIALQIDLTTLDLWADRWQMKFNSTKCEVMRITHNKDKKSTRYNISSRTVLRNVSNYKDLGVIMSSDLKWSKHVEQIVHKANKVVKWDGDFVKKGKHSSSDSTEAMPSHIFPGAAERVPLETRGDSRGTWKNLKWLLGNGSKSSSATACTANEAKDKCNTFNSFFVSCAEDLRSIHRSTARSFSKWLPQIVRPEKFNLRKITVTEVRKALKDLKQKKATGVDGIPSRLLKDGSDALAYPLSLIFNLTIQQNVIPAEWKKAKVTPLHKSGSKDDPRNYRPISVLPVVSKVLERLIHKQLASFFDDHNLLCKLQSGFRRMHSTETAVTYFADEILLNMDKGLVTGSVFIDLAKAFDTVDHDILLRKLEYYGICEESLLWFKDYFTGRKQFVQIDSHSSEELAITSGVPQGSILGPLLFIVYINDLPRCVKHCSVNMYADDTVLYLAGPTVDNLTFYFNQDLQCLSEWLEDNNLVLNVSKTKTLGERNLIMEDRGFTIQKLLDPLGVTVNIPSFLDGKEQLDKEDVVMSQTIASVRIYVERSIARIKKFKVLNTEIPLNLNGTIKQIWTVACLLCNFMDPLIKQ
ncbi:putative RNA-directed DNA polymerase from transposon BS [Stylophora pistillata]|uniref:Putative RNA-directed DNA polymerase from transposon BS n=1 Tax=Stylophora pistillata TaxID=50429 RepID=A0A2B4RAY1_STYPI|nr:putative RNA-directed DNA polymerase from transposon BS [Stylophora pistillata]